MVRVLEMADKLQGLAEYGALILKMKDDSKVNDWRLLELGSKALESYHGAFSITYSSECGPENCKVSSFAWNNELSVPPGFTIHQIVEGRRGQVDIFAYKSQKKHGIVLFQLFFFNYA